MAKHFTSCVTVAVLWLFAPASGASEVGQEVADQIEVGSYSYYLNDMLYTHDGHNRDALSGPQHGPARDNIAMILEGFGLYVELDEFAYNGTHHNVVATQLGFLGPDSYYVIGAHYDSVGNPGADDDASGVAGLLEIARVLSGYQCEYTIKYIAFDVEEYGMYGSGAYVDGHLTDNVRGMIAMDMIAWDPGNRACDVWGRTSSGGVKFALAQAIGTYSRGVTATIQGQRDRSDHVPFESAGFGACHLREALGNTNYHEQADSVDTPDYINYVFASDLVRGVAGYLVDQARVHRVGDCNDDGVLDVDEIQVDPTLDCNGNNALDVCDVRYGISKDCNRNEIPDECDILAGTSADANGNGVPDECDDVTPPSPDPMTFDEPEGLPHPISTTAITMTATQGSDPLGVEYYFWASGAGSHSRDWGPDRSYTDYGLQVNRNYAYRVKARDLSANHNETLSSATVAVATAIETPTALTFTPVSADSMKVVAPGTFTRLSTSQSGLFFEITKKDGTPAGGAQANTWVKTQTITLTGLTPGVAYRFRVKARNYYGQNETPWYPASGHIQRIFLNRSEEPPPPYAGPVSG